MIRGMCGGLRRRCGGSGRGRGGRILWLPRGWKSLGGEGRF